MSDMLCRVLCDADNTFIAALNCWLMSDLHGAVSFEVTLSLLPLPQVMVTATVNEVRPVDHLLVQRLMKEVEHLRRLLKKYSSMPLTDSTTLSAGHLATRVTDREVDIYHGQQTQSQVSTRTLTLADNMWSRAMSLADTMDEREGQEGHEQQTLGLGHQTHGQPDKGAGTGWSWTKEMDSPAGGGQSEGRGGQAGGHREGDKGTEADRESVREENRVLKREINALKARHLHDLKAEEKKMRSRGEEEREGGNVRNPSHLSKHFSFCTWSL